MRHIILGCASTGLAATNYDGFETAHSLFCCPVIDDEDKDLVSYHIANSLLTF